jgi:hypothetical protein
MPTLARSGSQDWRIHYFPAHDRHMHRDLGISLGRAAVAALARNQLGFEIAPCWVSEPSFSEGFRNTLLTSQPAARTSIGRLPPII